jgi:hypothetical protein
MSDLERRLTDALTDGAQDAPPALGLASAARARARSRRRSHIAGGAVLVALAIAGPGAVVALGGDDGRSQDVGPAEHGNTGVHQNDGGDGDGQDSVPALADGYRWESWHDVTIQVPDDWGYGSLSDWCVGGSTPTPRVQRPGTVANDILCEPASTYGLTFQVIDNKDDFLWPIVHQSDGGWPEKNVVGGRGIGGVLAMVATPTLGPAASILDSMRAIGPEGDPNGCRSRYAPDAANPPEGALSVCRYDETGALDQSEALFGQDAGDAVRALQAAPEPGECADASQGSQPHQVVVLRAAGVSATVDLVAGCPRVTVDGQVRELTPEVVYWALSPGWSGSVPDGVSLPSELRRR